MSKLQLLNKILTNNLLLKNQIENIEQAYLCKHNNNKNLDLIMIKWIKNLHNYSRHLEVGELHKRKNHKNHLGEFR